MESGQQLTATDSLSYTQDNKPGDRSFGDTLDTLCSYYMLCGVPCDEFWNGDYTWLKYYVETHRLAVEEKNKDLWLQGLYFEAAMTAVMSKIFSKRGEKTAEYPQEPIRITPLSHEEQEQKNAKMVNDFRAQLNALAKKSEARHRGDSTKNGNRQS